ncbi:mechanosensitive ion channel [Aureisphaera galaxeae]|uniref:mechanosensitive ion channel family protein n=1 Tax=Aureisphaera galaxeae TaxID=1538023 RepID=UPI002350C766|nr:mechanosensitive ion channel domain-containing protein [Aureisphaera galaxeae]MDC8006239.1 mechanosensitive ion channel [Aureisphaera galaxeae]
MQEEDITDKLSEVVKEDIWGNIKEFLNFGLHFGEGENQIHITIGLLLLVAVAYVVTRFLLKWVRRLFTRKMDETDKLKFFSFFKFIQYVVYVIVFFSILSFAGVNVTPVLAASAALLVGIGLALQEIFQDVIGGILIMIDKSLLVGDIVEVEGRVGRVIDIKLRTTRALTRDDKVIVIPNHKFITDSILNYTQNHKTTREFVAVGVAYGSDTQKVKRLLLESVSEDSRILKMPKPFVSFENFGDSSLDFRINFFVSDSFIDPYIKSDIRFKIDELFRENDITIPFPQRDIHIISGDLPSNPE